MPFWNVATPFICHPPSTKSAALGMPLKNLRERPIGTSQLALVTNRFGTSCEETDFSHLRQ
jgi:hypothetical protein